MMTTPPCSSKHPGDCFPAINDADAIQLAAVQDLVGQVLGPGLLGLYVHGSAAEGGLKPASDLDVLAVEQRSLDDGQRSALVDGLLSMSAGVLGARSIELTVVVQSQVRPWRYPPWSDFLYGDWLRGDIAAFGLPQPRLMPNLAIELMQVLTSARTLTGPPPDDLLEPVPRADVVRGSRDGIRALLADLSGDTRNVVLTLARIWVTIATGAIVPKDNAADWALSRLSTPHRQVLAHARYLYLTTTYAEEQAWPVDLQAQVGPYVEAVLHQLD